MSISGILNSIPLSRRIKAITHYSKFAYAAMDFLKRSGRTITISPSPRSNGHTLRLVFKSGGEIARAETLREGDAFAGKIFTANVDRIVLNSGAQRREILDLINYLCMPSPLRERLDKPESPHITIHYRDASGEKGVLSLPTAASRKTASAAPAIRPPVVPPPPAKEPPEIPAASEATMPSSVSGLRTRGKQLSRSLFQATLDAQLRREIEAWLEAVDEAIKNYLLEVQRGWTQELVALHDPVGKLQQQAIKIRKRMGITDPKVIVLSRNWGDVRRLPRHRKKMRTGPIPQPTNNRFSELPLDGINTRIIRLGRILTNYGYWKLTSPQQDEIEKLEEWLAYLLQPGKLVEEYGEEGEMYRAAFERFHKRT
ncbi:MAG: hypothetical protein HQ596_03190 [Candidatus Saganbacteria bacterium]|nr:hypothetical protein [Candidatus Saganbacteria bacterium]